MISFVRVDDRIIHGQIITRWSKEYPCDGIIAVNDKAATTPVLKQSFVASTDKKVFVWTKMCIRDRSRTGLCVCGSCGFKHPFNDVHAGCG